MCGGVFGGLHAARAFESGAGGHRRSSRAHSRRSDVFSFLFAAAVSGPQAVRCMLEDFEACIAHLACQPSVRKDIRTANLLERLFAQERRRTKTIHSFFGERPVLKLMYASVIRASDSWRGVRIGELELGQLERPRDQLINHHKEATKNPTTESPGSAPSPFYSKNRT